MLSSFLCESPDGLNGGDDVEFLLRRESLAPGTLNTYRYQVKSLLKPYFGLILPAKITTDMLSDYRVFRSKQKVVQDFADDLYPQLPRHLRALEACAFFAGGRKGEWLSLDWEEVDFEALIIRFVKTKNKHPREVPIIPGLMLDSLREALQVRNAAWPDESAVFTYDGHRMSTVGEAWDKACARAGHAGLLFHDMRRSANKNMRDRGISQGVRMKIVASVKYGRNRPYLSENYASY